jgi:hypothetical protein
MTGASRDAFLFLAASFDVPAKLFLFAAVQGYQQEAFLLTEEVGMIQLDVSISS